MKMTAPTRASARPGEIPEVAQPSRVFIAVLSCLRVSVANISDFNPLGRRSNSFLKVSILRIDVNVRTAEICSQRPAHRGRSSTVKRRVGPHASNTVRVQSLSCPPRTRVNRDKPSRRPQVTGARRQIPGSYALNSSITSMKTLHSRLWLTQGLAVSNVFTFQLLTGRRIYSIYEVMVTYGSPNSPARTATTGRGAGGPAHGQGGVRCQTALT